MTTEPPRAEYPLTGLDRLPSCSVPRHDPAFLATLMLEASLMQCSGYVRGEVLDVGCGRRPYEKTYFANHQRYVGLDFLTDRSKPDVVASALDLPFPAESFDTVVCTEVLEHLPEPLRALKEMRRMLRRDGFLILSAPLHWPRHEAPHDFYRYPYDGLVHLVRSADFGVVRLFNRGRSYAFLGQALQHVGPKLLHGRWAGALVNTFFLWCDRRRSNEHLTLGWTVVAQATRRASA